MTNIEKLTEKLNSCRNRKRIYNLLLGMSAEPSFQKIKDPTEKSEVLIGDVLDIVSISQVV